MHFANGPVKSLNAPQLLFSVYFVVLEHFFIKRKSDENY